MTSGPERLRVLIAEDQYLLREGTRRLLSEVPGLDVGGAGVETDGPLPSVGYALLTVTIVGWVITVLRAPTMR